MSLAWLALFLFLHRRQYLTPAGQHLGPWRAQMRRPILGSFGYAGGAMLGLVLAPAISLITLVLTPLYYALTSEGLHTAPAD